MIDKEAQQRAARIELLAARTRRDERIAADYSEIEKKAKLEKAVSKVKHRAQFNKTLRTARKWDIPVAEIARAVGLSEGSVWRIIREGIEQ